MEINPRIIAIRHSGDNLDNIPLFQYISTMRFLKLLFCFCLPQPQRTGTGFEPVD